MTKRQTLSFLARDAFLFAKLIEPFVLCAVASYCLGYGGKALAAGLDAQANGKSSEDTSVLMAGFLSASLLSGRRSYAELKQRMVQDKMPEPL